MLTSQGRIGRGPVVRHRVPATQSLRRDSSGVAKLKISTTGEDKGKFLTEAAFLERYTQVIPGILHVAGTAGAGAGEVTLGGATIVVRGLRPGRPGRTFRPRVGGDT